MKSQKKIFTTAIKTVAEKSLKRNANSTSCIVYYQPKAPVDLYIPSSYLYVGCIGTKNCDNSRKDFVTFGPLL